MTKVALLDYGMGNLHSAAKALSTVGADVYLTSDPKIIQSCDKILFPGVGAMRDCMIGMTDAGIDEVVRQAVFNKPVMAICVGMQALFQFSEENGSEENSSEDDYSKNISCDTSVLKHKNTDCLKILNGSVNKFDENWKDANGDTIKIPHMGWNTQTNMDLSHPLWNGIDDHSYFYFVHSFYCQPEDTTIISGTCDYGTQFCSSIIKENLFATQFHPEKSHTAGLQVLKNFVEWDI